MKPKKKKLNEGKRPHIWCFLIK